MPTTAKNHHNRSKWQDLIQPKVTDKQQLEKIESHLNLVLLATEAIAPINSEAILQAAQDLGLESVMSDRINLWRLGAADPLPKGEEKRKLNVEEVRSLVLIICHLAHQHQELLRRAVSLLEQVTEQNQPPSQTALLSEYLDRFVGNYQTRIKISTEINRESLATLAWKLLIDLLFYSGQNGHRLLWTAIFGAAKQFP